jgi:hypothetical protein
VTARDIIACFQALFGSTTWVPGWNALWDARGITSLLMEPDDLDTIADWKALLTDARAGGKSAVVTARTGDGEMAILVGRYGEQAGRPVKVFRTLDEAFAFLERPPFTDADVFVEVGSSGKGSV